MVYYALSGCEPTPSLQTMARNLHGLLRSHGQKSLRLSQLCPNKHHLNYQRTSLTSLNATLFSSTVELVTTNLSIAPDYLCSVKCRCHLTTSHPPELRWRSIPGDLSIKVTYLGTLPRKDTCRTATATNFPNIKVVLQTERAFLCCFWLVHGIGQCNDYQYLNYDNIGLSCDWQPSQN